MCFPHALLQIKSDPSGHKDAGLHNLPQPVGIIKLIKLEVGDGSILS